LEFTHRQRNSNNFIDLRSEEKTRKKIDAVGREKHMLHMLVHVVYAFFLAVWGLAFCYFTVVGTSDRHRTPADARFFSNDSERRKIKDWKIVLAVFDRNGNCEHTYYICVLISSDAIRIMHNFSISQQMWLWFLIF
jgi:hypothetical protein